MGTDLTELAQPLLKAIAQLVDVEWASGRIVPDAEVALKWKVTEFSYGERGVQQHSMSTVESHGLTWRRARSALAVRISDLPEYGSLGSALKATHGDGAEVAVRQFVHVILETIVPPEERPLSIDHSPVERLRKTLEGRAAHSGSVVELIGVAILAPPIVFSTARTRVQLRATVPADLERELGPFPGLEQSQKIPSAILDLEFSARDVATIQANVNRAVTVLRLFKAGSVKSIHYSITSDLLSPFVGGRAGGGEHEIPFEWYSITQDDVARLARFWGSIEERLPPTFWPGGAARANALDTAYLRYSDALLTVRAPEGRIANGVMGLEALLSKEPTEVSYRLALRAARLLSCIGYEAEPVWELVRAAYDVRSAYVHGDAPTKKTVRRIETSWGSIPAFANRVLDLLRASIGVYVLARADKRKLLGDVDASIVRGVALDDSISALRGLLV